MVEYLKSELYQRFCGNVKPYVTDRYEKLVTIKNLFSIRLLRYGTNTKKSLDITRTFLNTPLLFDDNNNNRNYISRLSNV